MSAKPNFFPRLIDNDEGEITVTVNGVEIRGWSYADRDEQYLKIRMAREFCEGWHTGFGAGLDRAQELFLNALGAGPEIIISGKDAPSLTVVSSDDTH